MQDQKVALSSSDIYDTLKNEIITLKLLPGDYISETETAKRFGVSRTPIRDVFKHLEYQKLVQAIPQKGTVITPIDLGNISHFMYVREKLELGVIEDILSLISQSQLAKLQLNLIQQRKLIDYPDMPIPMCAVQFFELDNLFHYALFKIALQEELWHIFIAHFPDYQRYRAICAEFSDLSHLQALYEDHVTILNCIKSKDVSTLKKAYKKHIYEGPNSLVDILSKKEEFFIL